MPPDDRSGATAKSAPVAALHALEHKVEHAVEEALHVAERSLARRFGAGCVRGIRLALRALWIALILAWFAFGALWLATRYYLMPRVDEYRPALEREASRLLGANVRIARIESGWIGFNPLLRFDDVQIDDRAGRAALTLPSLQATLSWTSVPALQLRFRDLWILTPELDLERQADGRFVVAGFTLDPIATSGEARIADWVLAQPHIGIRNARVRYRDAVTGDDIEFEDVDFEWRRGWISNRFAFRARPPAALAATLDLRGEYRQPWFERAADVSQWTGRVFAQTDYADVARSAQLTRALPATVAIARAQGALRAWLDFDRGRIGRFVADLALVDVSARLGERLEPLQVERLQGRVEAGEWGTAWEGGYEFAARQLSLTGAHLALPPTDVRLRVTRAADEKPERGLVEASGVSLATVSELATQLPLPTAWHDTARRLGVRGELANLRYTWEGEANAPSQYSLRTQFDHLSLNAEPAEPPLSAGGKPRPGRPGFENLSGTLEMDARGGAAQVRARDAVLEFPGIFEERLPFEGLAANARWTLRGGFELKIESLAATSRDLELTGQATWRSGGKGIGLIDASGQIARAEANRIYRVIPLQVAPNVRTWLRSALVAGTARDASFRLRGDLMDFPFAQPALGDFRVAAKIVGGALDYLPARVDDSTGVAATETWPQITGIDGDFVFERRKIEVSARRAQIYGVQLSGVRATLPELGGADPRLAVEGKGSGPVADMFRFVSSSPVGHWLGGFLARAGARGKGLLDLKLDIPLAHARDTRVRGTVTLADDDVNLSDDLPPFTRVSGAVEFTEKSLRIAGLNGQFLGGPFRAEVATRADGAIEIAGSGTATSQAARRLVETSPAQRLIDRVQGTARYAAGVVVKNRRIDVRVTSDLVGVAIDLPEPLRKAANDPLPLAVQIAPRDAADADSIRVTAGARFALALERARDANGAMRVERGTFTAGDIDALALPASGIRATVNVNRLDLDRWLPLLDLQGGDSGVALNAVAARVRELVIGGKSFANVVLGATREADGLWLANVNSDHASGAVTWRPAQPGNLGRVSARLARLTIPEGSRSQLTELLESPTTELPAFDVVANEFEFAGHPLGRLELQAQNVGTGPSAAWQVGIEFANSDGRLTASGQWQRAADGGPRRVAMNLALDFTDAGKLLARFGMPGALRGGEGRLEGDLTWRGSPFALDYPSLAGKLKLTTSKGQFLKADAGVARLLGVLSLQALPRRITLDFRDVFSEGFAFDAITATADVAGGVLTTRDFKMRGVNATVLLEGSADLQKETQNLHVLVLPEVNAGSASLAYALLNPAIGLGTFVAQWLLRDPLSRAFSHEFDITGTWSDPQVRRRERSPEVAASPK